MRMTHCQDIDRYRRHAFHTTEHASRVIYDGTEMSEASKIAHTAGRTKGHRGECQVNPYR